MIQRRTQTDRCVLYSAINIINNVQLQTLLPMRVPLKCSVQSDQYFSVRVHSINVVLVKLVARTNSTFFLHPSDRVVKLDLANQSIFLDCHPFLLYSCHMKCKHHIMS